jgi:segregation and condensation protein A
MAESKKYEIHLDNFDGPLDLLLHLIDKNKMDIYDIPIAVITEQYLDYLEAAREMDLEIASEFLLIAATLVNIKARMLLPKRRNADGEELQEEDPRAELVQRLVEYRFYKETAQLLQQREQQESTYMLKPQDVEQLTSALEPGNPLEHITMEQLLQAFMQVMEQAEPEEVHQLTLAKEEYLVEDSIYEIRQRLQQERSVEFTSLFQRGVRKRKIITIFMALLELCRLGELTFQQQNNFGALWIFPRQSGDEVK